MDKKISGIGLVLLFVGILLIVAFWPIFGVNARDIKDDEDNGEFKSYDEGDEVNVYGTITDIRINDLPYFLEELGVKDSVLVELEGDFWVLIDDQNSTDFEEGDSVYCKMTLKDIEVGTMSFEYWEVSSDSSLNMKNNLNYFFYIIAGLGIAVSSVGFVKE